MRIKFNSLNGFEEEIDKKERERLEEEGKVLEKGSEQSTENGVKDAGEQ